MNDSFQEHGENVSSNQAAQHGVGYRIVFGQFAMVGGMLTPHLHTN